LFALVVHLEWVIRMKLQDTTHTHEVQLYFLDFNSTSLLYWKWFCLLLAPS